MRQRSFSTLELMSKSLGIVRVTLARAVLTEAQEKLSVAEALRRANAFEALLTNLRGRSMYRFTVGMPTANDEVAVDIGQVVTVIIEDGAQPSGPA